MNMLWLQFDPNGVNSLTHYPNLHRIRHINAVGYSASVIDAEFSNQDPFGIEAELKENPNVQTLVVDSATTLADRGLEIAVIKQNNTSYDVPGRHGWGTRNQIIRRYVSKLMQIAAAHDLHFIITTHEHTFQKIENGPVSITLSLSENLANEVAVRFSEVWHMEDTGSARLIYTRAYANYKPMKTRMFLTPDSVVGGKFIVHYDANTWTGDGIAEWWQQWNDNQGRKIPLPVKGR